MKEDCNHDRVHRDSGWEIPDTVLQLSTGEGLHGVVFLCDGTV